jgi:hypothetical protein
MTGAIAERAKKVVGNHVKHPVLRRGSGLDLVLLNESVLGVQSKTGFR